MLCIALTLIFAGTSLSGVIDTIQHAPGASTEHQHVLFSDLTVERDHADDHHAPQPGDNDPADHLPGSHHHHGDSGSGMLIATPAGATLFAVTGNPHGLAPDNQTLGLRIPGPERPPKTLTMNA
ncbi:hypothetical protein [Alteraurantiacibacter palmitatis]|uniref:Secreted protein n=1 Tax=Alteraurantiacibacter palmitatis TaxID=2054628 RepID=A0ABV7E760_9SPHN